MILYSRKSNLQKSSSVRLTDEPYHIINIILAGLIVLVIVYSGVFSPEKNDYPVVCIHEKITGEPCFSCGLSHSFSLIIRGRINEAYEWNQYGMRVFLFFIAQLFFRLDFLRLSVISPENRKHLIIYDSVASTMVFLIAFWPFIEYIFMAAAGA
jgi:hypothetical protein